MPKENAPEAKPPATSDFKRIKNAAKKCLVCDFAKKSTQTVFGEGSTHASIVLVGEVPGDIEDRQGLPFVGPAGTLLDTLFEELKIERREIYVTNAVKHFKFEQRGKRRLHQKPNSGEIRACRPWLLKELELVRPAVILALGITAGVSICGRPVRIQKERGRWTKTDLSDAKVLISWHPSAILRSIDDRERHRRREELKADLKKAWLYIKKEGGRERPPS